MNTMARLLSLLAMAMFLTACDTGAPDDPGVNTPGRTIAEFNDADVAFAQAMIPHHEQAVRMAELAGDRAGAEVRELAADIEAAQRPEIEQLTTLLAEWGHHPPPDGDPAAHGASGMLSDERLAELERAEGAEFDTLFLESMVTHHEGALDMAGQELADGTNPEARQLAQEIVDAQEAEIDRMNAMLNALE